MEDENLIRIKKDIEKTFKTPKTHKAYPEYVYDRIFDMCEAHEIKPAKNMIEVLSFKVNGVETYTPMLTIAATRSIAQRAGWAGNDSIIWAEEEVEIVVYNGAKIKFPIWGQLTVYKMVNGIRCPFVSPKLRAEETVRKLPMWKDKPLFMFEKNIEAAALRRAFPEVLHEAYIPEEGFDPDNPDVQDEVDNKGIEALNNINASTGTQKKEEPKKNEQPMENKVESPKEVSKKEDTANNGSSKERNQETQSERQPEPSDQQSREPQDSDPQDEPSPQEEPQQPEKIAISDADLDNWMQQIRVCRTPKELTEVVNIIKESYTYTPDQGAKLQKAREDKKAEFN